MNNNQRDPRWANILIGDLPIGQIGCTVSAIGDVIGITPDVVVSRLKAVGGFLGNLIIWAKIPEAFPGITVNRVWSYNNDDVKANVPNVIVEVPAEAIGGTGSHWVNYIGNKQCKDPWTGTIRPTSDFPNPTGYCVISGKWTDNQTDLQAELDKTRLDRDKNWGLYQEDETTIKTLNSTIADLHQQLTTKDQEISNLKTQLLNEASAKETAQNQAKDYTVLNENFNQIKKDYDTDKINWNAQFSKDKQQISTLQNKLNEKKPKNFFDKIIYILT